MSLANLPVEATLAVLIAMSVVTWAIGISKFRHNRKLAQQGAEFQAKFWQSKTVQDGESVAKAAAGDFALLAQTGYAAYQEYQQHPGSLKLFWRPARRA